MRSWQPSAPIGLWSEATIRAPRAMPARLDAHGTLAALTVLLVPVHWVLGTGLIWGYGLALLFLLSAMRFAAVEWCLSLFYAALALGLTVAILSGESGERVIGALYNLSVAMVMLAFVNCGRRMQAGDGERLAAQVYRAAFVCCLVYLAYVACMHLALRSQPPGEINFNALILGLAGELPGVLNDYSRADVAGTDWTTQGAVWRIIGFGIYATEGAILMAVIGILASLHAVRRGWFVRAALLECGVAVALVLMASRTTLGGYVLSLALLGALAGRRMLSLALLGAPLLLAALLLAAIHGPGLMQESFESANEARAGSSEERFNSYAIAVKMVRETNIWTGLGVKPRDETLVSIPIGSHSTFVGAFTKGGLFALALLVLFYLLLAARIAHGQIAVMTQTVPRHRAVEIVFLSRAVLAMMIWWLTEDFDAPVQSAAIAGLCIGLLAGAVEPPAPRDKPRSWSEPPLRPAHSRGWR